MDVVLVAREMQAAYYTHQLAFRSKHAAWYERTSASLWLATLQVINRHKIPASLDLLLFARATLLYDTLCARLDPDFNFYKEYRRFSRDAERKAKKRVVRRVRRRLQAGPTGADYALVERLGRLLGDGLHRIHRVLSVPHDFLQLPFAIEKSIFSVLTVIRFGVRVAALTAVLVGAVVGLGWLIGRPIELYEAFQAVVGNVGFQLLVLVMGILHLRVLMFRMADKTRTL
jgi:hypothetical protein